MASPEGISLRQLREFPIAEELFQQETSAEKQIETIRTARRTNLFVTALLSLIVVGIGLTLLGLSGWSAAAAPALFYSAIGLIVADVVLSVGLAAWMVHKAKNKTAEVNDGLGRIQSSIDSYGPVSYAQFVEEAQTKTVSGDVNRNVLGRLNDEQFLGVLQEVDRRLKERETIEASLLDAIVQHNPDRISAEQVNGLSVAFHSASLKSGVLISRLRSDNILRAMERNETEIALCRRALNLIPQEKFNDLITLLGNQVHPDAKVVEAIAAYPEKLPEVLPKNINLAIGLLNHLDPQTMIQEVEGGEEYIYSNLMNQLLEQADPSQEAHRTAIARHPLFVAMKFAERDQLVAIFDKMSDQDKNSCIRYFEILPGALLPKIEESILNYSGGLQAQGQRELIEGIYQSKHQQAEKNAFVVRLAGALTNQIENQLPGRGFFQGKSTARARILREMIPNLPQIEPMFKAIGKQHEVLAGIIRERKGRIHEESLGEIISQHMDQEDVDQVAKKLGDARGHLMLPGETAKKYVREMALDILRQCRDKSIYDSGGIQYLLNKPNRLGIVLGMERNEFPSSFLLNVLREGGDKTQGAIEGLRQEDYQRLLEELHTRFRLDSNPSDAEKRLLNLFCQDGKYEDAKNALLAGRDWAAFEAAAA